MKTTHILLLAGIVCVMLIAAGCTSTSPATKATPAAMTQAPETTAAAAATPETTTAAATAPTASSWTGSWNTSWLESDGNTTISPMTLTQSGSLVTGTYSYSYAKEGNFTGSLNASVEGKKITGKYMETDNDTGLFAFELADDGNSFTGKWVHLSVNQTDLNNATLHWNGVRV